MISLGNIFSCLVLCNKLIDIEPSLEKSYQLIFRIYYSLNDATELTRAYEICQKNLVQSVGLKPSSKTKNLYDNLIHRLIS